MRKYTGFLIAAAAAVALSATTARAQDLVVATAGPMTGGDAVFGEQMKRGAEMAIKNINAAGGILGNVIDGGRSRILGTLLGGAAGALAGRAVDQNATVRCR